MTKIKQTKGMIRNNKKKKKHTSNKYPKYPRNSYPEIESLK